MQKKLRISLLLAIDIVFAIVELVTGYAVHSLALIADSFHMFNDILSLVVALWAVRVSTSGPSPTFSYGLQRAEVLGALVNAVFLLALCVTIFIEAIQRFVEPQEITNPKLILLVGVLGLTSNLVGLVLFNEHGHSHGGFGHSHGGGDLEAGGGGHSHSHGNDHNDLEHINSTSSLLQNRNGHSTSISSLMPENALAREEHRLLEQNNSYGSTYDSNSRRNSHNHGAGAGTSHSHSHSRNKNHSHDQGHSHSHSNEQSTSDETTHGHIEHHHTRSKPAPRSTTSMNIEGVFLHVLGDALGNVGVICTALFIWKTDFWWRFYFDPIVSLFITAIIFSTAIPLCLRASKVLLQATPSFVNCNEVAEDIQSIPGVEEIHDLHIWQLSETQVIGTLHATISAPAPQFGELSRTIQQCFAGHGVPSITIQPEFENTSVPKPGIKQCQSNGNFLTNK